MGELSPMLRTTQRVNHMGLRGAGLAGVGGLQEGVRQGEGVDGVGIEGEGHRHGAGHRSMLGRGGGAGAGGSCKTGEGQGRPWRGGGVHLRHETWGCLKHQTLLILFGQ